MESRAFYHGASKINIIKNFAWDEENTVELESDGTYNVVNTAQDNLDSGKKLKCGDGNRSGHYIGDTRRRCSNVSATLFLGSDGVDFNDIDDFNGIVNVSYVEYNFDPTDNNMSYNSNEISTQTTSIKRITVTVKKGDEEAAKYHYYSTNIGTGRDFVKYQ